MGGRIALEPVPPCLTGHYRDELAPYFDSFCRNGSLDPETLWDDVENKRRQLWTVPGMAAALTMVQDDNYQTCVITHCAGSDMKKWVHLFDEIEEWAKGIGCKRIEAVARPGWERILDMKKTHVILEKRL